MTIHQLPGTRPRRTSTTPEPRRSGEPWTTQDYELLVSRCREGASAAELAEALERKERPVLLRAKRLLPVDQRGMPEDAILQHLHRLLTKDADYDWAHHLAATPPPRPVVNHLPPPLVRRGIPGLEDEELLAIAGLVIRCGDDPLNDALWFGLGREIERRTLGDQLATRVVRDANGRMADFRGQHYVTSSRGASYAWGGPDNWHGGEHDPFSPGPHPDHEW